MWMQKGRSVLYNSVWLYCHGNCYSNSEQPVIRETDSDPDEDSALEYADYSSPNA